MRNSRIFYPRARHQLFTQLLRFGVVGTMGLVWDTATVYTLRPLIGLTSAILVAYFIAATINWFVNRVWTFRNVAQRDHLILQWLRFLAANSLGFFLNRGTVYLLCFAVPFCAKHPVFALAAGALAGLGANFNLSRRLVFRSRTPETPLELARMTVDLRDDDAGIGPKS